MKKTFLMLAGALFLFSTTSSAFANGDGTPFFTAILRCDANLNATDLQVCNDSLFGGSCIDFSDPGNPIINDSLDLSNKSNKIPCAGLISTVVVGLKLFCERRPTQTAFKISPPTALANATGTQWNWTAHCVDLRELLPEEE